MKHAQDEALDMLEPLLVSLREFTSLTERKRGVFYRKGRAFLHFHEDPTGLYADMRAEEDFTRYPVGNKASQRALLKAVRDVL